MKNINILSICLLSTFLCLQCTEDPQDKEQYFKQIYLVGAYDKVFTQPVMYHDSEQQETFVSVAVSGSLGIDYDVHVTLEIVPDAVPVYNEKYIGRYSSLPYYSVLPPDMYEIRSMQATLQAGGEPYERVPILLNTSLIHCDSVYALPICISTVSDYLVAADSTVLLTFKMENSYSATYLMSASLHLLDADGNDADTIRSGKNKVLKAVSQYETRMFFYDHTEDDDKIATDCLVLTVNPSTNAVTVQTWDKNNFLYGFVLDSGGTYYPEEKLFEIWYTYEENGNIYKIRESLDIL